MLLKLISDENDMYPSVKTGFSINFLYLSDNRP